VQGTAQVTTDTSLANYLVSVSLSYNVSYGGNFTVLNFTCLNPITGVYLGAGKVHRLNVTFWNPHGWNYTTLVELRFGNVTIAWNGTAFYEVSDPLNQVSLVGGSAEGKYGRGVVVFEIVPHWNISGVYDVYVYINDTYHNLVNETTYVGAIGFINTTEVINLAVSSTYVQPNETMWISGYVVYSGTYVSAVDDVYINGTLVHVDSSGFFNYTFNAPSVAGNYTYVIKPVHGAREYLINITVAKNRIEVLILTEANETTRVEDVVVEIRNATTGEVVKRVRGGEYIVTEVEGGNWTVYIYVHGIRCRVINISVTEPVIKIKVPIMKKLVDHLGRVRTWLTNASVVRAVFDNVTRRAEFILSGSGTYRLVYYCNLSKLPYVLCNVSYRVVELSSKRVILDLNMSGTANVTVLDPRMLRVLVLNPFGIPYNATIEFLNLTTWETLSNATLYTVPPQRETIVRVIYRDVEVKKVINLLRDLNLTVVLPYTKFIDYRGGTRELIANASITYENMSPKFPYSRVKVLVSGEGGFRVVLYIQTLPTRIGVLSNVTATWSLVDNRLIVEGRLSSTAEVIVEDLYLLRIELYDMLGNLVPISATVYINDTEYSGNVIGAYLYPEDYVIKLPKNVDGFDFYSFFDGYNETTRVITVNASDIVLKVWYRVPTAFKDVKVDVVQEMNTTALVRIEGKLLDYYGNPVPNRNVTIALVVNGTPVANLTATTDSSGYFTSDPFEVLKGYSITAVLEFSGDDTYVSSSYSTEIKVGKAPSPPPKAPTVVEMYPLLIIVIVVLIIVVITVISLKLLLKKTLEIKRLRYI